MPLLGCVANASELVGLWQTQPRRLMTPSWTQPATLAITRPTKSLHLRGIIEHRVTSVRGTCSFQADTLPEGPSQSLCVSCQCLKRSAKLRVASYAIRSDCLEPPFPLCSSPPMIRRPNELPLPTRYSMCCSARIALTGEGLLGQLVPCDTSRLQIEIKTWCLGSSRHRELRRGEQPEPYRVS